MGMFDDRWMHLLIAGRLGRSDYDRLEDVARGVFDRDYDRIAHSSNFRRLKDKTQVFPLSRNDFVRTRLTHTLEVSCIGRTLGRHVQGVLGEAIRKDKDIGAIVGAACLAHDIGNPPFGHSGEYAIQAWAKENVGLNGGPCSKRFQVDAPEELQDLLDFDGNAQSLRVVTRIQGRRRNGGMQLTLATLGAMMKYPCGSLIEGRLRNDKILEQKKCGYFHDDRQMIVPALHTLRLTPYAVGAFHRHPLAFLVEAADDISNTIVDLEDTVDQKIIRADEAIRLLEPLAITLDEYKGRKYHSDDDELERLRAYATHALTRECAKVFESNVASILEGSFTSDLVTSTSLTVPFAAIRTEIKNKAYSHSSVLEVEAAGFQVIGGLLDYFVPALVADGSIRTRAEKKLFGLFPAGYLRHPGVPEDDRDTAIAKMSTYQRILAVTDYISGMTDSFAVELYQKLSGIRLP